MKIKKICGILTEAVTQKDKVEAVLVGVGIDVNINEEDIPNKIAEILEQCLKKKVEVKGNGLSGDINVKIK